MDQKKKQKSPNGRKNLAPHLKRKRYNYYLNQAEHSELLTRVGDSNYKTSGALVRALILKENKSIRHLNPVSFLKDISALALQVNKIGVNINQLTKHLNEMALQKVVHPEHAEAIQESIISYNLLQQEIMSKLKELIKT